MAGWQGGRVVGWQGGSVVEWRKHGGDGGGEVLCGCGGETGDVSSTKKDVKRRKTECFEMTGINKKIIFSLHCNNNGR